MFKIDERTSAKRPQTTTTSVAKTIISNADAQAERLIAVLRMVLSATLFCGVSFLLFRLELDGLSIRRFELTSLLFGAAAYFTLGVVNFYMSHPTRFQPWQSWLFNALEIAILGFQLYVDVRDPNTPSLMALASPLLLVAALVIAVQALRYRLELHILTALAMIGVCAFVTFHDPQVGTPWTQSAIQEIQVLYTPPPNVMRIVILTVLGVVIAASVYRSRRLVIRVAHEVEDLENRKRFLPDELSMHLSDEALTKLREAEERNIVVVFCDIRGFTGLTENSGSRETAALLSRFRSVILDAAIEHEGVVDKFIGDGAMLVFGLQTAPKVAATSAVKALITVKQSLGALNSERRDQGFQAVEIASAIHTGPAVIGAIGDERRLEFTAIGDTINICSRLEGLAKDQGETCVASKAIVELCPDAPFTAMGDFSLRGSSQQISTYALTLDG